MSDTPINPRIKEIENEARAAWENDRSLRGSGTFQDFLRVAMFKELGLVLSRDGQWVADVPDESGWYKPEKTLYPRLHDETNEWAHHKGRNKNSGK